MKDTIMGPAKKSQYDIYTTDVLPDPGRKDTDVA
jgi:hypothetical protein